MEPSEDNSYNNSQCKFRNFLEDRWKGIQSYIIIVFYIFFAVCLFRGGDHSHQWQLNPSGEEEVEMARHLGCMLLTIPLRYTNVYAGVLPWKPFLCQGESYQQWRGENYTVCHLMRSGGYGVHFESCTRDVIQIFYRIWEFFNFLFLCLPIFVHRKNIVLLIWPIWRVKHMNDVETYPDYWIHCQNKLLYLRFCGPSKFIPSQWNSGQTHQRKILPASSSSSWQDCLY